MRARDADKQNILRILQWALCSENYLHAGIPEGRDFGEIGDLCSPEKIGAIWEFSEKCGYWQEPI